MAVDLPPPPIPDDLVARAQRWAALKRWERRDLGRALRALGLSYGEIAAIIPVSKGTLSGWCSGVELGEEARTRLAQRTRAVKGHGRGARVNRLRRQRQIRAIREAARYEARSLVTQPLWVAGVMLYWGEGTKSRSLRITNSDPELIRVAMAWFRQCLGVETERFTISLHLHRGQEEAEAKRFWSKMTAVPMEQFGATTFKQEGSGHRRNRLHHGTAQIRVRRSGDLFHRVMGWIEAWYPSGGPLAKSVIATDS